jgi:hypothetical protein
MHHNNSQLNEHPITEHQSKPRPAEDSEYEDKSTSKDSEDVSPDPSITTPNNALPKFMKEFFHVIQFCHLYSKGKIPPVLYSLASTLRLKIGCVR